MSVMNENSRENKLRISQIENSLRGTVNKKRRYGLKKIVINKMSAS